MFDAIIRCCEADRFTDLLRDLAHFGRSATLGEQNERANGQRGHDAQHDQDFRKRIAADA